MKTLITLLIILASVGCQGNQVVKQNPTTSTPTYNAKADPFFAAFPDGIQVDWKKIDGKELDSMIQETRK